MVSLMCIAGKDSSADADGASPEPRGLAHLFPGGRESAKETGSAETLPP